MRCEDALVYLCCTQDLPPDRLQRIVVAARAPELDWYQVFSLAHAHGVAPLVFQNLQAALVVGATIPADVVRRFKLATYQNALAKQNQADQLARALAYLHSHQIDVMLIKGMALDLTVYDHPWYTVTQDIDLILRPCGVEWQQNGLSQLEDGLNGLGIEYELETHHDVDLNGALPIDFGQIWRDARVEDFHGYPVFLMAPEDMLLAVCINSCRKRYFRLRSLCDIVETVKRFPHLDWKLFTHKAIAYGCNNIAYSALSVAMATVMLQVPCRVLDDLDVSAPRRFMTDKGIEYLVGQVPLASLSYYNGAEFVGRKIGWSLVLPYTTYCWRQMGSKIQEALLSYFF